MKKIILASITAVVVITVMAGMLIPILDDATATTDKFTNDGYYRMSKLDSESTYKLFWDHTKPYEVTVNDTDVIPLNNIPTNTAVSIVASNLFSLRFLNETTNPRVQMYGGNVWGFGGASGSSGTDFTVTVSNGQMTAFNTATENQYNITADLPTNTYAVDKDGANTMKKYNVDAYVLKDSSIVSICGLTTQDNIEVGTFGIGTVEDGLDYSLFRPGAQSETATFSNENIIYSDVSGYEGLVSLNKIEYSVTVQAGTVNPIYTYFIVPYEVNAERSVHFTDGENAIFNAIPVFVIIALLLGIVALVLRSRME